MTIHVSLVSKTIQNLYPGLAEDAQKEGAELLQPTTDTVTYSDGLTDEVKVAIMAAIAQQPGFNMANVTNVSIRKI